MKNVLILGANGYIGSRLTQILSQYHMVTGIDIGWFASSGDSVICDYHTLTKGTYDNYDVIIVLAGHSSVKTCEGPIQSPWLNNVTNFTDLLGKTNNQLIIYASSSSVYGNRIPGKTHSEEVTRFYPVNNYDVTKYVLDLHAETALLQGRNVIGLRFGTVNGWAPVLRTDVMINAMYETAIKTNTIQITNSHISRAILGLEDLCSAIKLCIDKPVLGIYNLASFNITVAQLGQVVANELDVRLVDGGSTANVYDFSLCTKLFSETFNFEFVETPKSILQGLIANYSKSKSQKRDQYIYYQWNDHDEL